MAKTARALVALIVAVSGLLVATGPEGAADPAPVRILLYGDSMTQGSGGDWTWRYRLWQSLTAASTSFDFVGPRNDLYTYGRWTLGNDEYKGGAFDRDVAAVAGMTMTAPWWTVEALQSEFQPDVVVGYIGINDLVKGIATADQLVQDWRDQIAAARAVNPTVAFVLVPLPHTWLGPEIQQYDDGLAALAAELDTPESRVVATAVPAFSEYADTYDKAHMTASGERKVATVVTEALAGLGIGTGNTGWQPDPVYSWVWAPTPTLSVAGADITVTWPAVDYASSEWVRLTDRTTGATGVVRWVTGTTYTFTGTPGHTYRVNLSPAKGFNLTGQTSYPRDITVPAT
ncbi:SGNH/GDSL hydrolase family protein [Nocardioides jiangxiensis]|uniref:GDSL-type esterase/lipase family protein n=1 Tax=Nocardioides jiangxiensis TaxID=3064524 RepID=A0ABT9B527_9ACTN|nr:GDSL-type esterase/lipase family protein [Nocardioides sp. WY-20]MDO7869414.1 GDSL-type esterase/lipase family protein [Nocardioides sp. WY-20]